MADKNGKTSKKTGKKDPAIAARTTAKNRARRIARDQRNKDAKAATAQRRANQRRMGALRRIQRRLKAFVVNDANRSEHNRLVGIEAKIVRSIK